MSWTRAGVVSAETQSTDEFALDTSLGSSSGAVISDTAAYSGSYSVRNSGSLRYPVGLAFPQSDAFRMGFMFRHNNANGVGSYAPLIRVLYTNLLATVMADKTSLRLFIDGTLRDEVSLAEANFNRLNTWMHIGFVYAKTSGFASMYIDGVQVLTYSGVMATALPNGAYIAGGFTGFGNWANYTYFDDLFVDVWTGESAPVDAPVPKRRFGLTVLQADGDATAWTPTTGSDNYAMLDEFPPDGDTTTVKATAANLTDLYKIGGFTLPADHAVRALIPLAAVKKSDAGVDSRIKLLVKAGGNTVQSEARPLATSFGYVWERWTEQPDGITAWDEAAVNAAQIGLTSAGDF